MRRIIAVVAVLAVATAWAIAGPTPAASEDGIAVYFSPRGGCTEAIIDQIENAEDAILVQAYSFTSAPTRHYSTHTSAACRFRWCWIPVSGRLDIARRRSFAIKASRSSSTPNMPSRTTRSW